MFLEFVIVPPYFSISYWLFSLSNCNQIDLCVRQENRLPWKCALPEHFSTFIFLNFRTVHCKGEDASASGLLRLQCLIPLLYISNSHLFQVIVSLFLGSLQHQHHYNTICWLGRSLQKRTFHAVISSIPWENEMKICSKLLVQSQIFVFRNHYIQESLHLRAVLCT